MDDGLRSRLRKLGLVQGLGELSAARAASISDGTQPDRAPVTGTEAPKWIRQGLPGMMHATPHGNFWLLRNVYPADYVHGRLSFGGLSELGTDALTLMRVPDLGPRPAFIDTETTGLAGGAGTLAFLVGVAVWEESQLVLHLVFMRSPGEEPAALSYLTDVLRGATGLVSFNGRGFDIPILQARYIVNRMRPDVLDLPHLDLLLIARQLWRDHLASRRLGELERQVLGVVRTDQDLESALIPMLYRQYLETEDPSEMARIFYHNEVDVLSLVSLLIHTARMITSPETMALAPGEWSGVGRVYAKAGCERVAVQAWSRALDSRDDGLNPETAARLWGELALRHKRSGEWPEALAIWDRWVAALPWAIDPLVEKAMYYEWVAGLPDAALTCCVEALQRAAALPLGPTRSRMEAELRHREERLRRRLANGEPACTEGAADGGRSRLPPTEQSEGE